MTYWQNKTCLVTGASSGLGLAITRTLATHGATVLMNARSVGPLNTAAETLEATGAHAYALPGDVTSQADVESIARQVNEQFGGIDFLCNCAGQSSRQAVLDTTPEDFEQAWEVNFLSIVRMTRAFAPQLIQCRGHLVNIGSLSSKLATPFYGGYPASKFAVAAYSQQLRLELGDQGLHVLLVCPGPIARDDSHPRYAANDNVPESARKPGGGANLKAIDPTHLAERILAACEARQSELIIPGKVRLLLALGALSPKLGDWLLKKSTSS
jgi:short-subunit dehydrogenase